MAWREKSECSGSWTASKVLPLFETIVVEVVCVGKASTYRGILQPDLKDFLSGSIGNSIGDSETGSKSDRISLVDSLAWLQTTAPIFKDTWDLFAPMINT